jgi:predicted lactoylglutathione lyase
MIKMFCKRRFFGKINEVIAETGNSREVLIAGDFNSRTENKLITRLWVHLGK